MFSGPMFRREYHAAARRRRSFLVRTFVAIVLGIATLLIGLVVFTARSPGGGMTATGRLMFSCRAVFIATICIELLLLMFFVPDYVGGAISEEREKDTLPMLLLTRLTPIEIVVTKTVARWFPAINLVLVGLPFLAASAWIAGLELEMVLALLVLFSSAGFMAILAILSSALLGQAGSARAQALAWNFGWLLGPPLLSIMPVRTGTIWGDLLAELKSLCMLVAPSSPLSLLTDRAWFYRPQVISLGERIALMIGLQAMFGLLMLGLATGRLQAREKNPNWLDPTRGHRPPCGDDPIFWREFELPIRRGGGSPVFTRLRYVWILIRAMMINLLVLAATLLALAVPIGILVATIHFGLAAFRELLRSGSGPNGLFDDRMNFNMFMRSATGLLALFPALNLASLVAGRITTERDKKTRDAILTTPLDGGEILRSKALAAIHNIWQAAWPLPILWALGLACGVVLPLGVALAALDLLLLVWVTIALGLYVSILPGPTSVASSRAALSTLVFFALHTPLLWAVLVSPRELSEFASWDVRLRWGLVLSGLAVPVLTGTLAWFLTRRTIDRFDEWVGRPCAARMGEREANASPTH